MCFEDNIKLLDLEIKYYNDNLRENLLKNHKGESVAIYKGNIIALGTNTEEVIENAFKIAKNEVFYLTKIGQENETIIMDHLFCKH
jgi:hypothetical protein